MKFRCALLFPLLGCGPKLSSYLQDPYQSPHPECNPAESILALGFSKESGQAAQQNAHSRIAEQIQSQIHSVVTKRNEVLQQQSTETSQVTLIQESVVESNFAYNHLIKDIGMPEQIEEGYHSLACLNVAVIEQQVLATLETPQRKFEQLYRDSVEESDPISFSAKRRKLLEIHQQLQSGFVVLHSLKESESMLEISTKGQLQFLETKAATLRKENPIALGGDVQDEYLQLLQGLMQGQGLVVTITETCEGQRYLMNIHSQQTPTKGPMGGDLHELRIAADLKDCISNEQRQVIVGDFSGYHSNDPAQAYADAWQKAMPETLPIKLQQLFPVLQPLH